MTSSTGATDEPTFEALYSRLEEVSMRLEAGNLPLADSIALYEEGMRLAQHCQTMLAQVEQRIERLRDTYEDGAER
ncbi:MAG: exodeoxyribonuclease VII small subunit [Chloroflexi bacterium]|nr:MAG: exodeoxyribonuclease VII small subunit [Chloroflexota bacterium]